MEARLCQILAITCIQTLVYPKFHFCSAQFKLSILQSKMSANALRSHCWLAQGLSKCVCETHVKRVKRPQAF